MSQYIMLVCRLVFKNVIYRTVTQEKPWRIFVLRLFFFFTAKGMPSVESENTDKTEALPVCWVNSR